MKKILIALSIATCLSIIGYAKNKESYNVNDNSDLNNKLVDNLNDENAKDKNSTELGDDLLSKKFELEGVVYSIPVKLIDFFNCGWSLEDETLKILKAGEKNFNIVLKKDAKSIGISMENQTSKDMPIAKCNINGVLVKKLDEQIIDIKIPGNIQIGSSIEEVKNIFSSCNYENRESDEVINYTCRDDRFSISTLINKKSGKVFGIFLLYN